MNNDSAKKKQDSTNLGPAIFILVLAFVLLLALLLLSVRFFHVTVDGEMFTHRSLLSKETHEVLKHLDISLGQYDKVTETQLSWNTTEISITTEFPVHVTADGSTSTALSSGGTVASILDQLDITYDSDDILSHSVSATVAPEMQIDITRVDYVTDVVTERIPYSTETVEDKTLLKGNTEVSVTGEYGLLEIVEQLKYVDGVLTEVSQLESVTLKNPINTVIAYGTKPSPTPTPTPTPTPIGTPTPTPYVKPTYDPDNLPTFTDKDGNEVEYLYMLKVKATAYSYAAGPVTATGKPVQVGYIAVDPKIIPYGSKMYIVSPRGGVVYGYCVAEDCGGAIKNMRVDLFYETEEECNEFGRRDMLVYVIREGREKKK